MEPIRLTLSDDRITAITSTGVNLAEVELEQPRVRPIVKWAGGKQWLAPAAGALAPKKWSGRYFEPFLGGAAFFFSLQPKSAYLSDANTELIATYSALREDPDSITEMLDRYPYLRSFYYAMRSCRPRSQTKLAARLIYLNRTCWNGLYRVNRENRFNTPFGKYKNPVICDEERLDEASTALAGAALRSCDFGEALARAKRHDFAYCDPPYITGHQNNGFLKYNAHLFDWKDQERLACVVAKLRSKGVNVLVSNADHHQVIGLYRGFYYYRLNRSTRISGSVDGRGSAAEALISSYPLLGCESEVI